MSGHIRPHAELVELCGVLRDGNLTDEQFARLSALLAESAEACRRRASRGTT